MIDNKGIRKILVVKLRNIGDVLLTAPLFDNLKAAFPQAQISALVNSGTQEMLTGHPALHQVLVYDRGIKKEPLLRRLGRELAFYRKVRGERFDLVLSLTEGDRGALIALLSGARLRVGVDPLQRGLAAKVRIFHHLVPPGWGQIHTVERTLEFLTPLGVTACQARVSFHFSPQDRKHVASLLAQAPQCADGYFHAHVTSRWMFKSLPHHKAAYLLDRVHELSGLAMVLTCAPEPQELEYLAALRPLLNSPYLDLSGALTLKQLGALSAGAAFFVGVDSAPMHMAAALDIPVLALFGPSSPLDWGPWDNACLTNPYRTRGGIQESERHLVLQDDRPCIPCQRDGCNGSKVSDCLDYHEAQLEAGVSRFLGKIGFKRG